MPKLRRVRKPLTKLKELLVFWGQTRKNFTTTGAIMPSGSQLARNISRHCGLGPQGARYLEVGPGTGSFTSAILDTLRPEDELVLVEINPEFVTALEKRFRKDQRWATRKHQVRIITERIESLSEEEDFDAIVCGLPFNNFDPEIIDLIFTSLMDYLKPGGWLSFFEYLAIRKLRAPFTSAEDRERLELVAACLSRHMDEWKVDQDIIMRNIPPAVVHHLQKREDIDSSTTQSAEEE